MLREQEVWHRLKGQHILGLYNKYIRMKIWKVFWDLQCPYSRANWKNLDAIKARFSAEYEFEIILTSLLFHPQAFTAQCAANLIEVKKGVESKQTFIDACFNHQEKFMNAAIGDSRPSEVDAVFATIAKDAGLLNDSTLLSESEFLSKIHDWEMAVKPAYTEHKKALGYGVYGTPKHVIDDKLIADAESSWGPDEWATKLKEI